jgi:hypothetical protein
MTASLTQVRNAIKATVDTALKSRGVTAYAIEPGMPHCPAVWSLPIRIDYHADFDGNLTYMMAVSVAVQLGDLGQAQTALDDFLAPTGAKSIVAILEADSSLGGVVDALRVVGLTSYTVKDMGGKSVLVAGFEVEIYA